MTFFIGTSLEFTYSTLRFSNVKEFVSLCIFFYLVELSSKDLSILKGFLQVIELGKL